MRSSSAWLLSGAVVTEVAGTLALRVSDGFTRWLPTAATLVGYSVSLWLFSLLPVSGSWSTHPMRPSRRSPP